MRISAFFAIALGACGGPSASGGDSGVNVDAAADAIVGDAGIATCARETLRPFAALDAFDVVSDGTTLYLSVRTAAGFELHAMPIAGGAASMRVGGALSRFQLASYDAAAFYAAELTTSTTYEIHEMAGGNDTKLAELTSEEPVSLAATSTDVYVLTANSNFGDSTLWRVPRSGDQPRVVTRATGGGAAGSLVLGVTKAAWLAAGLWLTDIPGPSNAAAVTGSPDPTFVGDSGFGAGSSPYGSSHTHQFRVTQFTPVQQLILEKIITMGDGDGLFSAGGRLYFTLSSESYEMFGVFTYSLISMAPDGTDQRSECTNATLGTRGRHDATNIYGLVRDGVGTWVVTVLAMS